MNRIDRKFRELRYSGKKAFIAFVTAGFPSLDITRKLVREFSGIGVDIIELGVPFSDPLADGPIIQEASQKALENNVHLKDILSLVKGLRKETGIPICLMSYYNPIFCFGEENFVRQAVVSGVDGVIIPDLPPEEGRSFIRLAKKSGLSTILFIAPTSSVERIKLISKLATGFIYYVSLTGVTGLRQNLPSDLKAHMRIIKKITAKPVCVGFGVSIPRHVRQIQQISDGAIVGSAIVKKIKENIGKPDLVKKVGEFVKDLKCIKK